MLPKSEEDSLAQREREQGKAILQRRKFPAGGNSFLSILPNPFAYQLEMKIPGFRSDQQWGLLFSLLSPIPSATTLPNLLSSQPAAAPRQKASKDSKCELNQILHHRVEPDPCKFHPSLGRAWRNHALTIFPSQHPTG